MRRLVPILAALAVAAPAASQAPAGRADAARLDREIEGLRHELVQLGQAELLGQGDAQEQRDRLERLNDREGELADHIQSNRDEISRLLAALQMHGRHPPPPLLVNPRSARDAVRAAILIRAIMPELEQRGRSFAAEAQEIARLRRDAAAASEALFTTESDLADRRALIERLTAEKRSLEGRRFDDGDAQAAVRALGSRVGSVGELVEALSNPPRGAVAGSPSKLAAPVRGRLVRRFGDAQRGRGRSQGWAWAAEPGSGVLSPAAGVVDYAGPLKGWGQVVILSVGGGYRLVLAGLAAVDVGVGRAVTVGEPVGRMDASAGDARPELYLEVRNRANPVDPARWMAASSSG